MKTLYPIKAVLSMVRALIVSITLNAQHQTLDIVSASGSSSSGGSISNQAIVFEENLDNPSGSAFIPFATPTHTASFSLSNQQYALTSTQNPKKVAVTFGNTVNTGSQTAGTFSQTSGSNISRITISFPAKVWI